MEVNKKDESLIELLQENARLPVSEIARRLFVSRTAAQMRLEKLEKNGIIDGYCVKLSSNYLKNRFRALVMIKFPPGKRSKIEKSLLEITQLTSLYSISGAYDLAGMISSPSMTALDEIIDRIGCIDGIDETMSSIILSSKINR